MSPLHWPGGSTGYFTQGQLDDMHKPPPTPQPAPRETPDMDATLFLKLREIAEQFDGTMVTVNGDRSMWTRAILLDAADALEAKVAASPLPTTPPATKGRKSTAPCDKCGAFEVYVTSTSDDYDDKRCHACGMTYVHERECRAGRVKAALEAAIPEMEALIVALEEARRVSRKVLDYVVTI